MRPAVVLVIAASLLSIFTARPSNAQAGAASSPILRGQGGAGQVFDRTKIPPPGKPPGLRVPVWTKSRLVNGADLIVSERHDLPLVSFTITFVGGANQYEPADRRGLASLVAVMMSEGTATRSGDALSNALQLLGTRVDVNVGAESGSIGFVSTTGKLGGTLEIMTDILLNATFPSEALERLRASTLVALTQAKDQPNTIASNVFARTLYGDTHPYGQRATESAIKAISRDDVVNFHRTYFQPGRAIVTVVGDVDRRAIGETIERALAAWRPGGGRPAFDYPGPPLPRPMSIYLVDKPGAAQSVVALGNPGPPRSTRDYYALQVMNVILGGQFQSRLNFNIREQKGYSYGVRSSFAYGKGPGAFRTGGDIVTAKTDAALIEFMNELRGIQGSRPVTDEELQTAKDALIQRLPATFGSVGGISSALTTLLLEGLPDDYYENYQKAIAAVTKEDVVRVARRHIDLDHLNIIIVGDRAMIEAPLDATGIAPIVALDMEGDPLGTSASQAGRPK